MARRRTEATRETKRPTTVGRIAFKTKAELERYIQGMVARYDDDVWLNEADAAFMTSLLERHKDWKIKVGAGIRRWCVRTTEYKNRCFWIERIDGSEAKASWKECIRPRTPRDDMLAAARTAVADQVKRFKVSALARDPRCAVTKEPLTMETADVDHELPFKDLVDEFFGDRIAAVAPTTDGDTVTRFLDADEEAAFAAFHKARAQLRLVSKSANLGLLRRKGGS